jgi:hypothetical protein
MDRAQLEELLAEIEMEVGLPDLDIEEALKNPAAYISNFAEAIANVRRIVKRWHGA